MSRHHPRKRALRHQARLAKQRRRIWGVGIAGKLMDDHYRQVRQLTLSAPATAIQELLRDAGSNYAVPPNTTQITVTINTQAPTPTPKHPATRHHSPPDGLPRPKATPTPREPQATKTPAGEKPRGEE